MFLIKIIAMTGLALSGSRKVQWVLSQSTGFEVIHAINAKSATVLQFPTDSFLKVNKCHALFLCSKYMFLFHDKIQLLDMQ